MSEAIDVGSLSPTVNIGGKMRAANGRRILLDIRTLAHNLKQEIANSPGAQLSGSAGKKMIRLLSKGSAKSLQNVTGPLKKIRYRPQTANHLKNRMVRMMIRNRTMMAKLMTDPLD